MTQVVTADALALARAVLDPNPDMTAIAALADCVSESINHHDFRFSAAYVETCEEVLRDVRRKLIEGTKRNSDPYSDDCILYSYEVGLIQKSIFNLQQQARQQFQREGP